MREGKLTRFLGGLWLHAGAGIEGGDACPVLANFTGEGCRNEKEKEEWAHEPRMTDVGGRKQDAGNKVATFYSQL